MFGLKDSYIVYSNRESGYGRYDIALLPKDPQRIGFLLEFKRELECGHLDAAAQQALRQINARRYETELRQHGTTRIVKIGMAFCGKRVKLASETLR